MRILFAHNRYQNLGGEDLAARVEMELVAGQYRHCGISREGEGRAGNHLLTYIQKKVD